MIFCLLTFNLLRPAKAEKGEGEFLYRKLKAVKKQPAKHEPDTWLIPRVYKGKTRSRNKSHRVIQERKRYMA
jgi:hypothetical protein